MPTFAYDQYESMKVGETKTFYFPSEVTSRANDMTAYNCSSDHILNGNYVLFDPKGQECIFIQNKQTYWLLNLHQIQYQIYLLVVSLKKASTYL